MIVEGVSQQLKFNHDCGLFITLIALVTTSMSCCNCVLSLNLGQN